MFVLINSDFKYCVYVNFNVCKHVYTHTCNSYYLIILIILIHVTLAPAPTHNIMFKKVCQRLNESGKTTPLKQLRGITNRGYLI